MKATIITAALFLSLVAIGVAAARADAPFHPPIALSSGSDMTRATIAAEINGRPYACVLDTGTSTMLVSQAVAQAAGLTAGNPVDEVAPDGKRYTDHRTHLSSFTVGGYAMHDVPALISSKLSGNTVLCGYDFFAQVPTLIDRDRDVVTLFPASDVLDRMQCVPIDLTPHVPLATLRINGTRVDRVVLDSGMIGGGAIYAPSSMQGGMACGLQATVALFEGAPPDPIALCASRQPPDGYNGIVETNLPTVRQLAIDYPDRRMCFGGSQEIQGPL